MSRSTRTRLTPPVPEKRTMSNTVISLIVAVVFLAVVGVMYWATRPAEPAPPPGGAEAASIAARPDSHRLNTAPGSAVTFVEFLDFECEACGAAYPAVEELRQQYGDRVNFVLRYFPVPSHFNAERAARAVEAAAQQGRLEPMYKMMYDTQKEWGEQQVPMDDRFRGYAQRLGLDMARFDAAYDDPTTLERIRAERQDGLTLGVQGTPTFFVDGRKVEAESYDDLTRALDDALAANR